MTNMMTIGSQLSLRIAQKKKNMSHEWLEIHENIYSNCVRVLVDALCNRTSGYTRDY